MDSDPEKEARLHNSRARYLKKCSPETIEKIKVQGRSLIDKYPEMQLKDAMELAVHQQQILDWMAEHPR
jgi:hypothetical protein